MTATPRTYSYLALGNSYTIGESVPAEKRWPVQLAGLLGEAGYNVSEPRIVARSGLDDRRAAGSHRERGPASDV